MAATAAWGARRRVHLGLAEAPQPAALDRHGGHRPDHRTTVGGVGGRGGASHEDRHPLIRAVTPTIQPGYTQ